jgi:hypothetical protein
MLVSLFRSNRPAILLGLIVVVPVLFVRDLFTGVSMLAGDVMPFHGLVRGALEQVPWAAGLLQLLLVGWTAVQLNALANNTDQVDRRNHLTALLFVLLLAAFDRTAVLDPALLGMPLVLWALHSAWSVSNRSNALAELFDAGVLIGLAGLFYLPYLFLVVVLWASVSVMRPFNWREYVLPVLGLVVVIHLCWGCLHLAGATPWTPLHTIADQGRIVDRAGSPQGQRWLLDVLLIPLVLVALYLYSGSYQRGIMRVKNVRSAFLAFCVAIGVIMGGVWLLNTSFPPVLLATPLAVLLSYAFMSERHQWLSGSAVFALLALALWVQWG